MRYSITGQNKQIKINGAIKTPTKIKRQLSVGKNNTDQKFKFQQIDNNINLNTKTFETKRSESRWAI